MPLASFRPVFAASALALLVIPSCKRKDEAKCREAQATVEAALGQARFAEARQWREYAYKQCADAAALSALDQKITAREAEVRKAEERVAAAKPLLELFASFVAQNATQADRAVAQPACPEKDQPDHGWCTGKRTTTSGGASIEVRYRKDEPTAFRYSTSGPGAGTCAQLQGQAGRTWKVTERSGGVATRMHCKVSGLDGVLSVTDQGTTVTVASPSFHRHDPNLKRQIESEGR